MDLFEEVIRLRREGKRGVMATIVHTNGSIPSFESSRMLVQRGRTDPGDYRRRLRRSGSLGGGQGRAERRSAAQDDLQPE